MNFFDSDDCKSEINCGPCRRSADWRACIVNLFDDVTNIDFQCPKGKTIGPPKKQEKKLSYNFNKAVIDAFNAAKKGAKPLCAPTRRKARVAHCSRCESFSEGNCSECGCLVPNKIVIAEGKCPAGKW